MIKQPWKLLGFIWAMPITIFGFLSMLILWPRWYRFEKEDWSMHFRCNDPSWGNKVLLRFNIGAITIGSIIIYSRPSYADLAFLVKHERVHVRQGMKFGIFNPFMYWTLSILAWAYGQDIYRGNEAEEQARYESGEKQMPDDIKPKDHTGGRL